MADVTITRADGSIINVLQGQLWLQRAGNWCAPLDQIDSTTALAEDERVTITWQGSEYSGYVLRSSVNEGYAQVHVLGGIGGLTKELQPRGYDNQILARVVVGDISRESGEQIAQASTAALGTAMGSWLRRAGSAGDQLSALTDALGFVWRVLPDGSVWVGQDSWQPAQSWEHDVPEGGWMPAFGVLRVIPSAIGAVPGDFYSREIGGVLVAGRVGAAVYAVDESGPSARLYFVDDRAVADNQFEPLRAFVRETMRGVELLATYTGRVEAQRADGTLDVSPDDKRLPPMTGVRVRVPVPGAKLTVEVGSRCQLVFEGGDVQQRVATLYTPGSDVRAVARVDDEVDCGSLKVTAVANGVFTGVYTPPTGPPIPFSLGTSIPLKGKITSGSPHLALPRSL